MDFPITVTGRHIEVTDPLREHAIEKMGNACRFLDKITSAHITFSVEKYRHIIEVVIQAHGSTLRGKEETADMYSSVDQVMKKIESQAKRLNEKIKDKKRHGEAIEEGEPEETPDVPKVIESETFAAKPLDVDDALKELEVSGDHFVVFRNAKTSEVNVLYRRKDGNYGLVRPH